MYCFTKVIVLLKIFNNNPLLKIVNDDYLLTIIIIFINDNFFSKTIVFNDPFFKNQSLIIFIIMIIFKNDCYLSFKSSKEKGCFNKRWFFLKMKRSFLKTIKKRNKKRSFNDRFQKWLTSITMRPYGIISKK